MIAKLGHKVLNTKNKDQTKNPHEQREQQSSINQQQRNHHFRRDNILSHWGINLQIFALDSVVV